MEFGRRRRVLPQICAERDRRPADMGLHGLPVSRLKRSESAQMAKRDFGTYAAVRMSGSETGLLRFGRNASADAFAGGFDCPAQCGIGGYQ